MELTEKLSKEHQELKDWLLEAIGYLEKDIDKAKYQIYAYRKLMNAYGFINEEILP